MIYYQIEYSFYEWNTLIFLKFLLHGRVCITYSEIFCSCIWRYLYSYMKFLIQVFLRCTIFCNLSINIKITEKFEIFTKKYYYIIKEK